MNLQPLFKLGAVLVAAAPCNAELLTPRDSILLAELQDPTVAPAPAQSTPAPPEAKPALTPPPPSHHRRITGANNRELFHLTDAQVATVKAVIERLS